MKIFDRMSMSVAVGAQPADATSRDDRQRLAAQIATLTSASIVVAGWLVRKSLTGGLRFGAVR